MPELAASGMLRSVLEYARTRVPSEMSVQSLAVLLVCQLSLVSVATASRDPLWVDEQITMRLIERHTWWGLLTVMPLHQPHYPTWFFIPEFGGWTATAVVSGLALPVTVYAAARITRAVTDDEWAPALTAVLVAASPFLATQSTWLRMYSVLFAVSTLAVMCVLEERPRAASALAVLAGLIHPFGAFVVLWVAFVEVSNHYRRLGTGTLLVGLSPAAAFAAANFVVDSTASGINPASTGMTHGVVPSLLMVALAAPSSLTGSPHTLFQATATWLLFALVVPSALANRRLALFAVLPVVGIPLASVLVQPVFTLKYYGFIAPVVAVLLAVSPRRYRLRELAIALVFFLYAFSWFQRLLPMVVSRRFIFWFGL